MVSVAYTLYPNSYSYLKIMIDSDSVFAAIMSRTSINFHSTYHLDLTNFAKENVFLQTYSPFNHQFTLEGSKT